jgi:single-strand DNA-binding protein
VSIAVWNKQAESSERYLVKGKRVAVDGRLRSRSWEEEGKRRTAIEVVANRVQFLSSPDEAEVPFEGAAAF